MCCPACRLLSEALPALQTIPAHALSGLVDLHLRSSRDLIHTIKLIIPQAFSSGSASPDLWTLVPMHSSVLGLLSNVMLLQNFHLNRAVAITAEMRLRISSKEQSQQGSSTQGGSMQGLVSSSSGSTDSSRATDSLQQPLQQERQQLQWACDLQRQLQLLQLLQLQADQPAAGSGASSGISPPCSLLSFSSSQSQAWEQQPALFMALQQQQQVQLPFPEEELACPLAVPQAPRKPLKERLQLQSQVDELLAQLQEQAAVQVQVQPQAHTEALCSLPLMQPPVPVAQVQAGAHMKAQAETPAAADKGARPRACAGAVTSQMQAILAQALRGQLASEGCTDTPPRVQQQAQAQTHPKPQRAHTLMHHTYVCLVQLSCPKRSVGLSPSSTCSTCCGLRKYVLARPLSLPLSPASSSR